MKRCTKCGELKPLAEFYLASGTRDGRRSDCKQCNLAAKHARYLVNPASDIERARKWAKDNPERYRENQERYKESGAKAKSNRKSHLKRKYGLTEEHYQVMLAAQGGLCAICRSRPAAHVDHDHESGRIRALLCFNFNGALGRMLDNPGWLMAAMDYLEQHRAS
ncbi:MAG: endonuclease VII domain-containing protein [Planctomycetaceae bacterium]|nr:endonuclease VII domain-containing protein [Planctomycetaceae bacterium]